jgi:hypothetical protein
VAGIEGLTVVAQPLSLDASSNPNTTRNWEGISGRDEAFSERSKAEYNRRSSLVAGSIPPSKECFVGCHDRQEGPAGFGA